MKTSSIHCVVAMTVVVAISGIAGCKKDLAAEKEKADKAVIDQLVGTWQTDVYQIDEKNAKTEVRFSKGKITKVVLVDNSGSFQPHVDSEGIRDSVTYFFNVEESSGKEHTLTASTDADFPDTNTISLTVSFVDDDSLKFSESADKSILVKRVKKK